MTRCHVLLKHDNLIKKRADLKDKNVMTDILSQFVFFENLITLPTDVSKSCNLSECCLHSCKHLKCITELKQKHVICLGMGPLSGKCATKNVKNLRNSSLWTC